MVVIAMNEPTHSHAAHLETALDFVNTLEFVRGEPVDHLGTTRNAVAWLREHELVHEEIVAGVPGEAVLRRVHRTRAALRELTDATFEGRPPSGTAIADVNRALEAREFLQLVPSEDGLRLDHRHVGDPIDAALARLAEPIVREVATGRPDRLRACADDSCRSVFYDDSRTGRRRWCDMAICGNRAKAARHRARAKGGPAGTVAPQR
jgi:predicted RNA-binding Zn ribbon-like protein